MAIIGVDIREAIAKQKAGKGVYAFNIISNLIQGIKSSDKLILFCSIDDQSNIPNDWKKNSKIQFISQTNNFFWHKNVAIYCKNLSVTHYFSPTSYITPYYISRISPKTKTVVTIHDLIVFNHPKGHPIKPILIEKYYLKKLIKIKSVYFSCVSESTKSDFLSNFSNNSPQIHKQTFVATNASSHLQKKTSNNSKNPYILSVSTVLPRKNYFNLIQAINFLKDKIPHKLVIVGGYNSKNISKLQKFIKQHNLNHKVEFTGFVNDEELDKKYSQADMLVIPSLYEGFGLPVLEGLSRGIPVICSSIPPFKEVGGDVAIYFDPNNPVDIANQIVFLANNKEQKQIFQVEGPKQAKKFNWSKSAKIIYEYLTQ